MLGCRGGMRGLELGVLFDEQFDRNIRGVMLVPSLGGLLISTWTGLILVLNTARTANWVQEPRDTQAVVERKW